MSGRWIDKRQAFEVLDGLRQDKVVAHFTDDGVYRVSQDAQTMQTIPLQDAVYLAPSGASTYTILPKHNGTTFVLDGTGTGINFLLPNTTAGKLEFSFVSMRVTMTTPHTLTPTSLSQIRGMGTGLTNGQALTFFDTGAMIQASQLTVLSNGTNIWWITRTGGTPVG